MLLLSYILSLLLVTLSDSLEELLLVRVPCLKALVCHLLCECALGDTTIEVLLKEDTLTREDATCGVTRLCTDLEPIESTVKLQIYCSRISVRIIRTYPLNKLSIPWSPAISDDDTVEGVATTTESL